MTSVNYLIKEISAVLGAIKTEPMQDLLLVDAFNKGRISNKKNSEKLKKHPSRGAYIRGCRCKECRAINNMMVKRYRDGLKNV